MQTLTEAFILFWGKRGRKKRVNSKRDYPKTSLKAFRNPFPHQLQNRETT